MVKKRLLQRHCAAEIIGRLGACIGVDVFAHAVELSTQPAHKIAEEVVGMQADPLGMHKARRQGLAGLVKAVQVQAFGHAEHGQAVGVFLAARGLAHQRLELHGRQRQRRRLALLRGHVQLVKAALEIGVLVAGDHRRKLRQAHARRKAVGTGDGRAQQRHKLVDELVVLHQIAAQHRIVQAAGPHLVNEAVVDAGIPNGLVQRLERFRKAVGHGGRRRQQRQRGPLCRNSLVPAHRPGDAL